MATAPKAVTPARPKAKDDKKGKEKAPTYPSEFGSHTSMINAELNGKIAAGKQDATDPWQILTDERGSYATRQSRLDTGMSDPNRCSDQVLRDKVVAELTAA